MTTATAPYSARNTITADSVFELPLGAIAPSALNPRTNFDEAALDELAESIAAHGLLQPIVVRPATASARPLDGVSGQGGEPVRYEVVAGERRFRAAGRAGLTTIPAIVREDLDDGAALRIALIENLARQDLDPIEEAEGYARLAREGGMRQREIAAAVHRSQPAVANAMRLLDLPEDVRGRIRAGELSVSHGIALCRFKDFPRLVQHLAEQAVTEGWTAKRLEDKSLLHAGNWALKEAGLLADVYPNKSNYPYMAPCADCPLGARRASELAWQADICLRPDHLAELRQAWQAERLAAVSISAAEHAAIRGAIPLLSTVGPYTHLAPTPPAGCSEACPCFVLALNEGGQERRVCTDPARHSRLEAAETKAKNRVKRAAVKDQLDQVLAAVDEVHTIDRRSLALVVAGAFRTVLKSAAITEALKRHAPELTAAAVSDIRQDLHPRLAELHPVTLLRIGVEVILRAEIREAAEYASTAKRTAWWLGPAAEEA